LLNVISKLDTWVPHTWTVDNMVLYSYHHYDNRTALTKH